MLVVALAVSHAHTDFELASGEEDALDHNRGSERSPTIGCGVVIAGCWLSVCLLLTDAFACVDCFLLVPFWFCTFSFGSHLFNASYIHVPNRLPSEWTIWVDTACVLIIIIVDHDVVVIVTCLFQCSL